MLKLIYVSHIGWTDVIDEEQTELVIYGSALGIGNYVQDGSIQSTFTHDFLFHFEEHVEFVDFYSFQNRYATWAINKKIKTREKR